MMFEVSSLINLKGYIVRLKVDNEEYEGLIVNVIPKTTCVSLGKVRVLSDDARYPFLNFFGYEIESYVVVRGPKKKSHSKKSDQNKAGESKSVKLRPLPIQLKDKKPAQNNNVLINGFLNDDEAGNKVSDIESEESDGEGDEIISPPELRFPIPQKIVFIDKLDDEFNEAISCVLSDRIIGICLEGVNIGRRGKVYLISISARNYVFLFDIFTLGKEAFDNGLKEILQKTDLLKIFHDCRQTSDALFHQYGVKLVNIFDTQVTDAYIYKKSHNRLPENVRTLDVCLSVYLKLEPKDIDSQNIYQSYIEGDLSGWMCRPLPKRFKRATVKHVIYLKELRIIMMERLMADINRSVEVCLSVLRDCSEKELELSPSIPHLLPLAVHLEHSKHNKAYQKFAQFNANNESIYDTNLHREDPYNRLNMCHYRSTQSKKKSYNEENLSQELKNVQISQNSNEKACRRSKMTYDFSSSNSSSSFERISKSSENVRSTPRKCLDWPIAFNKLSSDTSKLSIACEISTSTLSTLEKEE